MIKVGCVCRLGHDYPASLYVSFCMCVSIYEPFLNSTAFGMVERVVRWPRVVGERQICEEKRFDPNNSTSFIYKRCINLVGVSQTDSSMDEKDHWSENTKTSKYSMTISEKCMDLEETTSIIKVYACGEPTFLGVEWLMGRLAVWLYAGRYQADGLQKDIHCPSSCTRALPE